MQTFWILMGACAVTILLIAFSRAVGFRLASKRRVVPGTVLTPGWGHGFEPGDTVRLNGSDYRITAVDGAHITIGERL